MTWSNWKVYILHIHRLHVRLRLHSVHVHRTHSCGRLVHMCFSTLFLFSLLNMDIPFVRPCTVYNLTVYSLLLPHTCSFSQILPLPFQNFRNYDFCGRVPSYVNLVNTGFSKDFPGFWNLGQKYCTPSKRNEKWVLVWSTRFFFIGQKEFMILFFFCFQKDFLFLFEETSEGKKFK